MYILLIILFVRPLTVILHELGHGLAALYVAKGPVSLFFGSYGDRTRGMHFRLGRLHFHFSSNIYLQSTGLCIVEKQLLPPADNFFFIAMGPLTSLLAVPLFLFVAFQPVTNEVVARVSFFSALSSALDFLLNIIPSNKPIQLHNGGFTYNDGRQLLDAWRWRKHANSLRQAYTHCEQKEYLKAAALFHFIANDVKKSTVLHRLAIATYIQGKDHASARSLLDELSQFATLDADDLTNRAYMHIETGDLQEAVKDMDLALKAQPDHVTALNNRGFAYEQLGRYDEALADLDRAISINPDHAFAHNNRGLVKVRTGDMAGARQDIDKSFELDGTNPYMFRNRGILHLETGEHAKALEDLLHAQELDASTHQLDEYLQRVRGKLAE